VANARRANAISNPEEILIFTQTSQLKASNLGAVFNWEAVVGCSDFT
jgi:hypothetical protein